MISSIPRHSRESGNPYPDVAPHPAMRELDSRFRGNDDGKQAGFTPVRCSAEHGFTLVELMVVIVIVGLLTTLVAINVIPLLGKGNTEKAKADIAILGQALEQYRLDNLNYPATAEGLTALRSPPATLATPARYRAGGYIKKLPQDPWGRAYQYANPGPSGGFDVYSLGADGAPGGEGENADIHSD